MIDSNCYDYDMAVSINWRSCWRASLNNKPTVSDLY